LVLSASDVRLKMFAEPLVYEKTVVVRYSKKLAEKCSTALKSVMFKNDFDNVNKRCRGWKRFYWI